MYDAQTQQAVIAFRKMAGLTRNAVADASVFAALAAGEGAFTVSYPSQGRHIEADLTHQVLALIGSNGAVQRLYQISSGKPSTPTQLGTYRVYWKEWGTNSDGMVDSSFFNGGDALHGFVRASYGSYQSNGCVEMPVATAAVVWPLTPIGTLVTVVGPVS